MKLLTNIISVLLVTSVYAQTNPQKIKNWELQILNNSSLSSIEYKDSISQFNLGLLWLHSASSANGIIGENYERMKIKIISVFKDKNYVNTYHVSGKSMVKNYISKFVGTIKIDKVRIYNQMHWGVDDEYKNKGIKKQGIIIAQYHFEEDSTRRQSGIFDGLLSTIWYIDKCGRIKYDDIEMSSDSYNNNQFVGTWKEYKSNISKVCNWGDFRIPLSGDLDIGAGEFSPADKYLKYGWQSFRDAYTNNIKQALMEEKKQWWK